MPEQRIVIEGQLGVERKKSAIGGCNKWVDLD